MSASRDSDHRLVVGAVATLLAGVAILWTLYSIRGALLVIYVSGLLAVGFSPTIRWLEGRRVVGSGRLPRWTAILVVYFGILGLLAAALALMLPPLIGQAAQLWQEVPNDILRIQARLVEYRVLDHRWTVDEVLKTLPGPGAALPVLLGALQSVVGTIGTLVGILVLPYYLL